MESVFGFVSVLPGAFSAYRWKAINDAPIPATADSQTPLDRYLKLETPGKEESSAVYTRNMVGGPDGGAPPPCRLCACVVALVARLSRRREDAPLA